jgi:hypothetical protein
MKHHFPQNQQKSLLWIFLFFEGAPDQDVAKKRYPVASWLKFAHSLLERVIKGKKNILIFS